MNEIKKPLTRKLSNSGWEINHKCIRSHLAPVQTHVNALIFSITKQITESV